MHGNARLTPLGRLAPVMRIESGRPVAHVAAEMAVSRPTAYKWWRRWSEDGLPGLADRPSRARRCPHRTDPATEASIAELRRTLELGPVRIGARLGVAPSTVHRVLCRQGLNRLAWMDRPTGRVIRRIETTHPGELIHVDVKKLGRIPPGGGWRVRGRSAETHHKGHNVGYAYLHTAVYAHSRLACTEALGDERAPTCAAFWRRAAGFFADRGIAVEAVLTDNAWAYRYRRFHEALDGVEHRFIRPHRPQTNGKVERFHRTWPRSGPTSVPTARRPSGWPRWTSGSTSTTITGTTPPSVARPSAV